MAELSSPYVHQTDSSSGCSFSLLLNCKMFPCVRNKYRLNCTLTYLIRMLATQLNTDPNPYIGDIPHFLPEVGLAKSNGVTRDN
jgi:hypothetical protein